MAKTPDVVVIGGGIIGLTSAYFLAKAGFAVAVLDRGDLGQEASWAGAGIIPPGNPERAATPIDALRAIGSARFPGIANELHKLTGIDTGYRMSGGIEVLQPDDEYVLPLWQAEGIAFERINTSQLHQIEPELGAVGGDVYVLPQCAQVRNPWHLRALIAACERFGVQMRPRTTVEGWVHHGSRINAVRTGDGSTVHAGRFLIAAGAWSENLLAPLGCQTPIFPVRGQIVLYRPARPLINRIVMVGKEYLVPRTDGRLLVGSTEEPAAGFEKANTPEGVSRLKDFAVALIPALRDAPVEKCWSGLRPGSQDGSPFIGTVPGFENTIVAAGHFRAGVQLSIGTAQLVCDIVQGKTPSVPLTAFHLDRSPQVGARPTFRS